MALTPKRQRFVDEYLIDMNGTKAAIRAGFAESGARIEATRLLANAAAHSYNQRQSTQLDA